MTCEAALPFKTGRYVLNGGLGVVYLSHSEASTNAVGSWLSAYRSGAESDPRRGPFTKDAKVETHREA